MTTRLKVAGMALLLVFGLGPGEVASRNGSLSILLPAHAEGASALDTPGIDWLRSLPEDEWQRLDNGEQGIELASWLITSLVNQARLQMDLAGDGGEFERVIRKYIFYFHPEYEYWFPPYLDLGRGVGNPLEARIPKQVRWPVWVKRKSVPEGREYDENFVIHLGREEDDERDIYVKFNDRALYDLKVMRWRYLPGVEGPPKVEELKMKFLEGEARFTRTYYNDNRTWEVYRQEELLVFERGDPEPVVDRLSEEPQLEITGVEDMFTLPVDDWERVDGFWYFRGLINLARLQFGLTEEGGEFEALLRRDFFYYYPWEPWYESVDVERKGGPTVRQHTEKFQFEVGAGAQNLRDIEVTFLKALGIPGVFDWGIGRIILRQFFTTGTGVPGTEERAFWLDFESNPRKFIYDITWYNPDGTVKDYKIIAEFIFGNPDPVD